MLPSPHLTVGMVFSGLQTCPLFPQNVTRIIMHKKINFSFIRPQDLSVKIKVFVPCLHLHLQSGFFLFCFCQLAPSAHVATGLLSLWIMTVSYQLQPASSQGLLLVFFWGGGGGCTHISYQNT